MIQTVLSWSASALVFGVSLLAIARRDRNSSSWLLFLALLSAVLLETADMLAVASSGRNLSWKYYAVILEALVPAFFHSFSLLYARVTGIKSVSLLSGLFVSLSLGIFGMALFSTPEKLFYSPDFPDERVLFLSNAGFVYYIIVFLLLVRILFNLEATYRSAARPEQWQIKFTLLGVGSLVGFYLFYYSQGLLYRSINMNLAPLRTLALFVAGGLLAYSLLRRDRPVRVTISKEMAYRSVVVAIIGGYLLVLGIVGEGLRHFGEASGQVLFISFIFLGTVSLVAVLLSEQFKRKLKVFINKNFFDNKYDYRSHWLQFTGRLAETRNTEELDAAILSGFCDTFAMGGAMLYLWSDELSVFYNRSSVQEQKSEHKFSRTNPLIEYIGTKQWVFNAAYYEPHVIDANRDFLEDHKIAFIVPIFAANDLDGFIAMVRPINPGEDYTYEDYDLMKTLARQAAFALTSARLSEQLAISREMEAVGKVTAFVMHDLKNLVYSLALLASNANDYISDPEFQKDLLSGLSNSVAKMKLLISKLKDVPERISLNIRKENLGDIVNDAVASLSAGGIKIQGSNLILQVDSQEIGKVVTNLVINALDATDGKGPVLVEYGGEDVPFIRVTDSGCGMTPEFILNDLFTPFKTTKSKGLGIGLFQSRQIVEAHMGKIEVSSDPGKGSTFTVWLPLMGPDSSS